MDSHSCLQETEPPSPHFSSGCGGSCGEGCGAGTQVTWWSEFPLSSGEHSRGHASENPPPSGTCVFDSWTWFSFCSLPHTIISHIWKRMRSMAILSSFTTRIFWLTFQQSQVHHRTLTGSTIPWPGVQPFGSCPPCPAARHPRTFGPLQLGPAHPLHLQFTLPLREKREVNPHLLGQDAQMESGTPCHHLHSVSSDRGFIYYYSITGGSFNF